MADLVWTTVGGRVARVEVIGKKRSWFHLREGQHEWKVQCPPLYESRKMAYESLARYEIDEAIWLSWASGKNDRYPKKTSSEVFEKVKELLEESCRD